MVWGIFVEVLVKGVFVDFLYNVLLECYEVVLFFVSYSKYGWGCFGWMSGGNYNVFICLKDGERSVDVINIDIDKVIVKYIFLDMNMYLYMFVVFLWIIYLEYLDVKRMIFILFLLGFVIFFVVIMNYVFIFVFLFF